MKNTMKMSKNKKKPEAPTEPTIEEKIKSVLAHYGNFNRHVRRMWGKLVGLKIPPLTKPLIGKTHCRSGKCTDERMKGSRHCSKHTKHNGKK